MTGKISDNLGRSSGLVKAVQAGRTGTVDWQTDSIKTSTFTATNGEGYFAKSLFTAVLKPNMAILA